MSDLVKVQNTPQFIWYTWWTLLGANGMPDKLIEEGLKQPNRIKISFKKETKEITGHVTPDQAQFGTEYFLAYRTFGLNLQPPNWSQISRDFWWVNQPFLLLRGLVYWVN